MSAGESDPFQTAQLRARVLSGWAASPSRFREDANAEEDYALGGYRDRVVVELAQNAADAAARAGVPGRLRLTLRDGTLTAANTGAPLAAAGVEALSTLRASGKRGDEAGGAGTSGTAASGTVSDGTGADSTGADGIVGRFGVGFAAAVAVSDAPRIHSAAGSVSWSRERTWELAQAIPALHGEIEARSGHVPVLRLPFASPPCLAGGDEPAGLAGGEFVTVVELPLRDAAAEALVTWLLGETGPALLLALPALDQVEITTAETTRLLSAVRDGDRTVITVNGVAGTWRVASAGGQLDPALLAGRPAEERTRLSWSVRLAVPVNGQQPAGLLPAGVPAVLHAPTPTDDPLSLPALLLASFPLTPDRRHVAPGPLTDFLLERAADSYAALLPALPPGPALLDLVPRPVGAGELDARLAKAILSRLPQVPFLAGIAAGATASGEAGAEGAGAGGEAGAAAAGLVPRIRPRDAVLLETAAPGLRQWLAPVLPDLVAGPVRHPAWAALGVRRLPLAELADQLAALDRDPAWWRGLYAALDGVTPEERAELGALPVPLADGRLVRGPRGVLLPGRGLEQAGQLAVLGLRVADPRAAHPLLARLGAVEATPRSVLEDPATRAAVRHSYDSAAEASYDDDSPQRLADAVLALLSAVDAEPGEYPWLGELALPGEDGDWYPAAELLLPGAPLAAVLTPDAPFGTARADLVARHGRNALLAAGVAWSFSLLRAEDAELDESAVDLDLDAAGDWAADTRERLRPDGDDYDNDFNRLPSLPPAAVELTAVRDLDLVDPGRWPQALELLTQPPLRAALTEPTRVRLPDGRAADVPSYTAWWLRRHVTLGGRRPAGLLVPGGDQLLAGLYDPVGDPGEAAGSGPAGADPAGADPALARLLTDPAIAQALGARSSLAALLAEPGGADDLLTRLADPARPVTRRQLRALWLALAAAVNVSPRDITPPVRVRVIHGDQVTVSDADDVLVLDAPDLWPLVAGQPLVLAGQQAPRLADLLDLPLASEEVPGTVESPGERRPVPAIVSEVLPGAPGTYTEHDPLMVDGADLPWRYADGELHAATVEGLACGLAWAAGQWEARHLLAALLMNPDEAAQLLAESDLDRSPATGTWPGR